MLPKRALRLVVVTAVVLFLLLALRFFSLTSLSSRSAERPIFVPNSFNWKDAPEFFPPASIRPLPNSAPRPLPKVQAHPSFFSQPHEPDPRRDEVLRVFKRSYYAYRKYAWLRDELAPVSGRAKDTFGGWAATLVDTLDTLWIMGLEEEFSEAAIAVTSIDFSWTSSKSANLLSLIHI